MTIVSPLAAWWRDQAALAGFRRRALGRRPAMLAPRDDTWRSLAPGFEHARHLAAAGVPFQVAADRRHDRRLDPARLHEALAAGATVLLPQAHQVLPRVARLMAALRVALLGPFREECSYLFLVQGRGREGMGLHHDGDVDAFWVQLEGRRTVTLGPPVPRGTPEEIDDAGQRGRGWRTLTLRPGSLLYVPPRAPHRVVCRERSLALTLTWSRPPRTSRSAGVRARALVDWDVASGHAEPWPAEQRRDHLWTQVPAVAGPLDRRRRRFALWTPDGAVPLPARVRALAAKLGTMPLVRADRAGRAALEPLVARGILGAENLPLLVVPGDAAALDGWRF